MAVSNRRGQLYYDRVMTNLAPQYASQMSKFIGEQIAPPIWSDKQSKAMYTFDLEDTDTIINDKIAPGTQPNQIDSFAVTSDIITVEEHGLSDWLAWQDISNEDAPINSEKIIMQNVLEAVMLQKELAIRTLLTTAGNFTNTSTPATKWDADDGTAVDPRLGAEGEVGTDTAHGTLEKACGLDANVCLMGVEVLRFLLSSPVMASYASDSKDKNITLQQVANFFNVDRVLVGNATYNTAKKGQTKSKSYIWGKDVIFGHVASLPAVRIPSLAYNLKWNMSGSGKDKNSFGVVKEDFKLKRTSEIAVFDNYKPKLTFEKAGYLFKNVIS